MMRRPPVRRWNGALALSAVLIALLGWPLRSGADPAATPAADPCNVAATPAAAHHAEMAMGTPVASDEFDRLYIDMMIPHHASIVPVAHAALQRVSDDRLRSIAESIAREQTAEIAELRGYRAAWYGSADPQPVDEHAMMRLMPAATTPMDEAMAQMDAATQVARFCAAADADRAFIDLTIPHHQSAIEASEAALGQATHPELRAFAERVIADQRREIAELRAIRQDLYGEATPVTIG